MFGRNDTLERLKHKLLTVELCDVIREYRVGGQPVRALDETNLVLQGGQLASIVGPSGVGKSTLLHVLGALDSPASGSIIFDGQEIGNRNRIATAATTVARDTAGTNRSKSGSAEQPMRTI